VRKGKRKRERRREEKRGRGRRGEGKVRDKAKEALCYQKIYDGIAKLPKVAKFAMLGSLYTSAPKCHQRTASL